MNLEARKFAIARAHVNANEGGVTFVLALKPSKTILCTPLKRLQAEHPYGLAEEDVFYTAEPGVPVPKS